MLSASIGTTTNATLICSAGLEAKQTAAVYELSLFELALPWTYHMQSLKSDRRMHSLVHNEVNPTRYVVVAKQGI